MAYRSVLIQWRARDVVADTTVDPDLDPDANPLPPGTKITITPAASEVADMTTTPPVTYYPQPIVCGFDADGDLYDPVNNAKGIRIIDPTDTTLQPHDWTLNIRVDIPSQGVKIYSARLTTPEPDGSYYLTRNMPMPAYTGTATSAAEYATQAANSATAAAASAASINPGVAGGVATLDESKHVPVAQVPDLSAVYAPVFAVSPELYGAVGDGVADDTAALQAAIDAAVGGAPAAGASTVRVAVASVQLGKGKSYKVTAPLKFYSVQGLRFAGLEGAKLVVSGALSSVLDINGSAYGVFEDFAIIGQGATDTATYPVQVEWDSTVAARSTTGNVFRNITVRNLKYVYGFAIATANPGKQNDNATYDNCRAFGQWVTGETTYWQAGFSVGNGTHGNVVGHTFIKCMANANRYNHRINASASHQIIGGGVGYGDTDVNYVLVSSDGMIDGLRSEHTGRLVTVGGGSASASVTVKDCLFAGGAPAADGQIIQFNVPGQLIVDNLVVVPSVANANIRVGHLQSRTATVLVRGGSTAVAASALVTPASASTSWLVATVTGYAQTNASGQVIAATPLLTYDHAGRTLCALDALGAFRTGSGATAARPAAPAAGAQWFDATLGKPIWWNGTAWVDATGATV